MRPDEEREETEEEHEEHEETEEEAQQREEVEQRARSMGWRPEDEYRGPKDKWVDAGEFVRKGEEELPILRERLRNFEEQDRTQKQTISGLRTDIAEVKQTLSEFSEHARTAEENAYARARADIQAEMDAAVEEGDVDTYKEKKVELQEMEKEQTKKTKKSEEKKQNTQVIPPEVQAWVDNNDWFSADPVRHQLAVAFHDENLAKGMTEEESLKGLTDQVKKAVPGRFGIEEEDDEDYEEEEEDDDEGGEKKTRKNKRKRRSTTVSEPRRTDDAAPRRRGSKTTRKKTYEDLPPDAKKACDKFVSQIPGYKKEDYIKQYYGSQEV